MSPESGFWKLTGIGEHADCSMGNENIESIPIFYSIEPFHMQQMLRDLELILMFFMLEMSDDSGGGVTLP